MNEQTAEKTIGEVSYFIDLAYFDNANRSFGTIIRSRLCSKCQQRMAIELEKQTPEKLLSTVKDCCSKLADFITPKMPVSEKLFRIFLTSGNRPLKVTELITKLADYSTGSFSLSDLALRRLLDGDQYYGFSQYSISNFEVGKDSSIG